MTSYLVYCSHCRELFSFDHPSINTRAKLFTITFSCLRCSTPIRITTQAYVAEPVKRGMVNWRWLRNRLFGTPYHPLSVLELK